MPSASASSGGSSNWGSGFLPTAHSGVLFRSGGEPVLFLGSPPGIDRQAQRDSLDALRTLNEKRLGAVGDPEIAARISRRVNEGMVFVPMHYREAAANLITNDVCDPYAKTPEFKVCAVRIEKK